MENQEMLGIIVEKITKIEGEIAGQADKQLLSVEQAAEYMHITVKSLYTMCHHKKIPYYKPFGKNLYFDRKELDSFMRQNYNAATAGE